MLSGESSWVRVGAVSDFPNNGGAAVLYGKSQLAVYNVARRNVSTAALKTTQQLGRVGWVRGWLWLWLGWVGLGKTTAVVRY